MTVFLLRQRAAFISVLFCGVLLLSACASPERTERTVEKRATARWNAVLSEDFAGAYEYLSPGFRSSVSAAQYQRSILLNRVRWTGARYNRSECTETTCKVTISLDYALYGGLPGVESFEGTQTIYESWVRVNGKWYFVPSK